MNSNCPQCGSDFRYKFARIKSITEDKYVAICPVCSVWLERNMYPGEQQFNKYSMYLLAFLPIGPAMCLIFNYHWLLSIVFLSTVALSINYFLDKKYRKSIDTKLWPYWAVFKKK